MGDCPAGGDHELQEVPGSEERVKVENRIFTQAKFICTKCPYEATLIKH